MKETAEEMDEVCLELLRVNELESAYIRPFVFYGSGAFGTNPKSSPVHNYMAAFYPAPTWGGDGGRRASPRWSPAGVGSPTPASYPWAKGSGQYSTRCWATGKGPRAGYDEALMLNDAWAWSPKGAHEPLHRQQRGGLHPTGFLEDPGGLLRNTVIELLIG